MLSIYNERIKIRRRRKLRKLPKISSVCPPHQTNTLSQLPKLPPINMPKNKFYEPDIGRNALIKLCGYPSSTQNIDEMIANKHFIL